MRLALRSAGTGGRARRHGKRANSYNGGGAHAIADVGARLPTRASVGARRLKRRAFRL
jgi:hypothetical protein